MNEELKPYDLTELEAEIIEKVRKTIYGEVDVRIRGREIKVIKHSLTTIPKNDKK